MEEKNAELSRQCEDLKIKLERSEKLSEERRLKINDLESKIAEQKENINYLEEKSRADEELRKKLHNAIQVRDSDLRWRDVLLICNFRNLRVTSEYSAVLDLSSVKRRLTNSSRYEPGFVFVAVETIC